MERDFTELLKFYKMLLEFGNTLANLGKGRYGCRDAGGFRICRLYQKDQRQRGQASDIGKSCHH